MCINFPDTFKGVKVIGNFDQKNNIGPPKKNDAQSERDYAT